MTPLQVALACLAGVSALICLAATGAAAIATYRLFCDATFAAGLFGLTAMLACAASAVFFVWLALQIWMIYQ